MTTYLVSTWLGFPIVARAVAAVFVSNGVPARQIDVQGAGDALPIAPNSNHQRRRDNNRVQIVDVPSAHVLKQFLAHRKANPTFFRSAPQEKSQLKNITPAKGNMIAARPAKSRYAETEVVSWLGLRGGRLHTGYHINLGMPKNNSLLGSVSLISNAMAAGKSLVVGSCLKDRPHMTTKVRNYATGRALQGVSQPNDALPGLYGQPWIGIQHRVAIALLHVYVPKGAGTPVPPVTVKFYRWGKKSGFSKHPIAVYRHSPVNVYRGSHATLYRVFLHGSVQCIDLYVLHKHPQASGLIIFPMHGKEYNAVGQFQSKG